MSKFVLSLVVSVLCFSIGSLASRTIRQSRALSNERAARFASEREFDREHEARIAAERESLGWRLGYEIRLDRKLQTYIDSDEISFREFIEP